MSDLKVLEVTLLSANSVVLFLRRYDDDVYHLRIEPASLQQTLRAMAKVSKSFDGGDIRRVSFKLGTENFIFETPMGTTEIDTDTVSVFCHTFEDYTALLTLRGVISDEPSHAKATSLLEKATELLVTEIQALDTTNLEEIARLLQTTTVVSAVDKMMRLYLHGQAVPWP